MFGIKKQFGEVKNLFKECVAQNFKPAKQNVEIVFGWEDEGQRELYNQNAVKFYMATATNASLSPAEKVERIKKFLRRERLLNELKGVVSYLIPNRSDIKLVLNPSGGSFTDGNTITLGVPDFMQDSSEKEMYIVLRALLAHEAQHIKSSNFNLYKKFIEQVVEMFGSKDAELKESRFKGVLQHIAVSYGNGIEDGRIERIIVYVRPGYLRYLKFLRATWWKAQPVQKDNELMDFLWAIVTLATTGLLPKGFDEAYAGTALEAELQRVEARVIHATGERTAADCLRACLALIEDSADYMIPLVKAMTPEEQNDLQNQMPPEWTTSNEEETNESGQGQGQGQNSQQSQGSQQGSGSNQGSQQGSNQGQGQSQPQPSPVHFEKPKSADKQGAQGSKDGKGQEKGQGAGASNGNEANGASNGQGNSSNQSQAGGSGEAGGKATDQNKKSRGGSNLTPSESWGVGDDADEVMNDATIDEMLGNILNELDDELEEVVNGKSSISKNAAQLDEAVSEASSLSKQEVKAIIEQSKLGHTSIDVVNRQTSLLALPIELSQKAKKFRKDVEYLFKNKSTPTLFNQTSGLLDVRSLIKIPMKNAGIMKKEGRKESTNYVAYMIRDESGSMGGQKNVDSAYALSIAEEGLKNVIPLKIIGFRTANSGIRHTVIKDFDDRSNKSYSYSHLKQNSVGGGNADGVAIRVATAELLKRPEKDRLLFVFSDGLPSAYKNSAVGMADVREAIREARRVGIKVFCIMFGSDADRNNLKSSYEEMYGRDIITCPSHLIEKNLKSSLMKALRL